MAEASSSFANDNPVEAGELAVSLGSVAIPNGAVVGAAHNAGRLPLSFTRAVDARPAVSAYLRTLMDENPGLVGGSIPTDDFYYVKD